MGSRFVITGVTAAALAMPALAQAATKPGTAEVASDLAIEAALAQGREQRFRPTLLGPGAELRWSRLLLSPAPSSDATQTRSWGELSLLAEYDGEPEPPQACPDLGSVVPSLATAAGSLLSGGVMLMERDRDGATLRRHRLRGYFRRGGLSLVWRMEF